MNAFDSCSPCPLAFGQTLYPWEAAVLDVAYDAIIIGARVAGATLAAFLGDAGYRVLLIDRAHFPSSTLSTHFFRGSRAVAVLHTLGLLPHVLALGAPPLVCQYSYTVGGATPTVRPPQEPGAIGYALSVRREALDELLVRRATASPTVEFLDGTRLSAVLWDGARVSGAQLATPAGPRTVRARLLIGADGRHSLVARAVGAANEAWDPPHRALYYVYLRDYAAPRGGVPDGPEFSRIGDEMAYVFPSDAGLACMALSVNPGEYAQLRTRGLARFRERLTCHHGLAERFAAATVASRLLGTGPEPSYVRAPAGPGWALVGDAGMHQDPWGGHGIDMPMTHATALAQGVTAWFSGAESEESVLGTYQRERNEPGLALYEFVTRVGRDLRVLAEAPAH